MRVIAGKHRGKRIETLQSKELRPTMGRAREALFNILTHGRFAGRLEGAVVLDLYCGSGSFAIEALSRGAARAVLIDINNDHLAVARNNITHLGETEKAVFLRADSSHPPSAKFPCDVVFMDPPYREAVITTTLTHIARHGWLTIGAVVIAESHRREEPAIPAGYEILENRIYGACRMMILEWKGDGETTA